MSAWRFIEIEGMEWMNSVYLYVCIHCSLFEHFGMDDEVDSHSSCDNMNYFFLLLFCITYIISDILYTLDCRVVNLLYLPDMVLRRDRCSSRHTQTNTCSLKTQLEHVNFYFVSFLHWQSEFFFSIFFFYIK